MAQVIKVGGYAVPVTPSLLWVRHKPTGFRSGLDRPPGATDPTKESWLYARFRDTSEEIFCDVRTADAPGIIDWIAAQMGAGAPVIDVDAKIAEIEGRFEQGRWVSQTGGRA
jgi:hypothetical protein